MVIGHPGRRGRDGHRPVLRARPATRTRSSSIPSISRPRTSNNRTGVRAMCVDCRVPHSYPEKLIVKAEKGIAERLMPSCAARSPPRRSSTTSAGASPTRCGTRCARTTRRTAVTATTRQAMDTRKQSEDAVKQHKEFALRQGHVHRLPHRRRAQRREEPEGSRPSAADASQIDGRRRVPSGSAKSIRENDSHAKVLRSRA